MSKAKTIKVEFVKDHIMFIDGKRRYISSKQLRDKEGKYKPRRKYAIPYALHDELLNKDIIKNAKKTKVK